MLRTVRHLELVEGMTGGSARNEKEDLAVHEPEPAHAMAPRHGAHAVLNTESVGGRALRSFKRLRARLDAAVDLDDAKRIAGQTCVDIGAALDYDRKIVARILVGDAPFEVGHLRLLPWEMAAIILGRLVARLPQAARAMVDDEERRVREAVKK
jgi:hypothetical protein